MLITKVKHQHWCLLKKLGQGSKLNENTETNHLEIILANTFLNHYSNKCQKIPHMTKSNLL